MPAIGSACACKPAALISQRVASWLTLPLLVSCTSSSSLPRGRRHALLLPLLLLPLAEAALAACLLPSAALLLVLHSLLVLLVAAPNMPDIDRA
jgi:hypothetical protein